jgi:hypothetical protein
VKAHDEWIVLPHGKLEALAENVWCVQGSLPGMSLRRNMTLARFADGSVLVHSPVALEPAAMHQIDALGRVRYLVVPSSHHVLDAKIWKRRYATAQVLAPRGAREAIARTVPVDLAYDELRIDDATVQLLTLEGVNEKEGALLVRSSDGTTVILNDAIMNMAAPRDLVGRLVARLLGMTPGPRVSRLVRLGLVKDAAKLKADLRRFTSLPDLVRLVVAHDRIARGTDARAALETAMTFL